MDDFLRSQPGQRQPKDARSKNAHDPAEVRLFYVALTRARSATCAIVPCSFARITAALKMKVEVGRMAPAGYYACMRKAASITPCLAITRSPKRCVPTSMRPALGRIRGDFCFAPHAATWLQ
jgi:ATP-dependent exoDNAse (exonuclease V) beta subunit